MILMMMLLIDLFFFGDKYYGRKPRDFVLTLKILGTRHSFRGFVRVYSPEG